MIKNSLKPILKEIKKVSNQLHFKVWNKLKPLLEHFLELIALVIQFKACLSFN
jgi:hypothetical protein